MVNFMKTKAVTILCLLAFCFVVVPPASALEDEPTHPAIAVIADTVIARPACLAATVIGSAFFVISLPWAAASRSVKASAHTLVVRPAQATFTRPLGEFPTLTDY
jgi:hypothetical protein